MHVADTSLRAREAKYVHPYDVEAPVRFPNIHSTTEERIADYPDIVQSGQNKMCTASQEIVPGNCSSSRENTADF